MNFRRNTTGLKELALQNISLVATVTVPVTVMTGHLPSNTGHVVTAEVAPMLAPTSMMIAWIRQNMPQQVTTVWFTLSWLQVTLYVHLFTLCFSSRPFHFSSYTSVSNLGLSPRLFTVEGITRPMGLDPSPFCFIFPFHIARVNLFPCELWAFVLLLKSWFHSNLLFCPIFSIPRQQTKLK